MSDPRHETLARTGPMKLHATALLARGDESSRFEAAVMLHEVVREEWRALELLGTPSPTTSLATGIEATWLLLDGLDPQEALSVYRLKVLPYRDLLPTSFDAMCSRLEPRLREVGRAFATLIGLSPSIQSGNLDDPARSEKELEIAVARYPGVAYYWLVLGNLSHARGDKLRAWQLINRACRLDPQNEMYIAAKLAAAPGALTRDEIDAFLDETEQRLVSYPPLPRLTYCVAVLTLVETQGMSERTSARLNALDDILASLMSLPSDEARRAVAAVGLFVHAVRSGQRPTAQMLRDAGLGHLVDAATPDRRDNPIYLLYGYVRTLALAA